MRWPWRRGGGAASSPPQVGEVYELGGRRFVAAGRSTLAHDAWCMAVIRKHAQAEGESDEAYGLRLIASGCMFELMGGLLLPAWAKSQQWSPQMAAETSRFIGAIDDPEQKAHAYPLLREVFHGFFESGRRSAQSSPPSLLSEAGLMDLLDRMSLSASGAA